MMMCIFFCFINIIGSARQSHYFLLFFFTLLSQSFALVHIGSHVQVLRIASKHAENMSEWLGVCFFYLKIQQVYKYTYLLNNNDTVSLDFK